MDNIEKELLTTISGADHFEGAYNIRKNGKGVERKVTENINIVTKEDVSGIDIFVKENTKFEYVYIPVIVTESGLTDIVYNDFYIGKNAKVWIIAGCGIHNDSHKDSHYGEGDGKGKKILNPVTEVHMKKGSSMEMQTTQIKGVDSTIRKTNAVLEEDTSLVISEKLMTHGNQLAKTEFHVELNGKGASTQVTSRSVATENSEQHFISDVIGNSECFGHVECDAIIKDKAKVLSDPRIIANNTDANLVHEAAIGKIAGEQLIKLMTLGLNEKEAEEEIINGFLK